MHVSFIPLIISVILSICDAQWEFSDTLSEWTTSSRTLPNSESFSFTSYHKDSNTIWMLGGSECSTCVVSYNLDTNTITNSYSNLEYGGYSVSPQNSVMINHTMYYYDATKIRTYNIATHTQQTGMNDSHEPPSVMQDACLTKNKNNTKLYITGDYNGSKMFYIYDLIENKWIVGPNTTYIHSNAACQVSQNHGFLYIKGRYSNYIEKTNIGIYDYDSDNSITSDWIILNTSLTIANGFIYDYYDIRGIISVSFEQNNIIYLIGGYVFGDVYSNIITINTINDTVSLSTQTNSLHISYSNAVVTDTNQIYILGGSTYVGVGSYAICCAETQSIVYSNELYIKPTEVYAPNTTMPDSSKNTETVGVLADNISLSNALTTMNKTTHKSTYFYTTDIKIPYNNDTIARQLDYYAKMIIYGTIGASIIFFMIVVIYHKIMLNKSDVRSDTPNYFAILKFSHNITDMWSDIFFAIILYYEIDASQSNTYGFNNKMLFIVSSIFVIIPYFLSLINCIYWINHWRLQNQDLSVRFEKYFTKYIGLICAFVLISNFYATIELLKSKIFYKPYFNFPLKNNEFRRLQHLKFINIVILEVCVGCI